MGEVLESVWEVVDAVHKSHQLDIVFPECHDEQLEMHGDLRRNLTSILAIVSVQLMAL
jgi:hypothetical protein